MLGGADNANGDLPSYITGANNVSPHTFRHSFAMHLLYGHVHPKVLQGLLGHEKFESTEVYTKIFALDVAASQQLRFTLDTQDALQLLRIK
ncbi:tyrosine-type recombinase/integrase [Citrobacter freundii]|uniref:tyrosine-type recombinase/integrase n=1 Tax=Citrobacter freundii TaxID=546 RepID=UPI001F624354|nr:tyrosine-type recombinase/integrase [Citrobacter freundii]